MIKLSTLISVIFLLQLGAATVYSQKARVTINVQHAKLSDVLEQVEQQTDYLFFYNKKNIDIDRDINLQMSNVPVSEVLDKTLGQDVSYLMVNDHIILSKKSDNEFYRVLQQGITVAGTVSDESGEPMPGVNVVIKGTGLGVVSDNNGHYSINVPGKDAVLVFSFIGYVSQELTVGDRTNLSVLLAEDTQQIAEVVVVGYGTQKKVNLTGSVASVDMSKMTESRPITSLSSGLAGLAAGVTIRSANGGQPGNDGATIRVRGQGTLNNSDPLVVVDGVAGSNINDVNPQDVESISILKDAASSSIYGSRAANGVVLITTKKGSSGVARINYHGYLTKEKLAYKTPYVTNYADFMELMNEGLANSGQAKPFSQAKINEWRAAGNSDPLKYPNSDWQDFLYDQGWMQNHALSISGGTDKIRYFVSGNYLRNPGIIENSGYNRISARANLDVDVKPWFKLGVNSYGYNGVADIGYGNIGYLNQTTPGWVYRHPDGRFGGGNNAEDATSGNNLIAIIASAKGSETTNKIVSRFYGKLTPLAGLSIEGSYTYDFTNRLKAQHSADPYDLWNFYDNNIRFTSTPQTSVTNTNYNWKRNQMDAVARYETNVSHLNIQAMAGVSQEAYKYEWFAASKSDLTADALTVLDAGTTNATATGTYTNWAMHSFFSRVGLIWADKYLLEANLRMDWSSRFAAGKTRRGVFPAFSAGWRISEEDFMQNISWLNNLKLRASYGALGNNRMGNDSDNDGNYNHLALYASQNYVLNNAVRVGWAQTALSNAAITWETTYVNNLGIDFGILKSRLNGSIDFFIKNTKNILIDLPAPLVHGTATIPRTNAGEVRNTGIEFTLSWNDKAGDVRYFVEGNFGYVKNKVTKFKGKESSISGANMIKEGQPINVQYVMKVDRLVQTDEDLAYVQSLVDKKSDYFRAYLRPEKGDFLYADTNGDDDLTADDRIMIGNGTNPTVTFGARLGVSWKGFDLSCLLQGVSGYRIYFGSWETASYFSTVVHGHQINKTVADGRWYEGRPDKATFPKLRSNSDGRNNTVSDFWLVDRSYLRVKNIQLGYTVPKTISQKILLENIRFYMSIDNALTFTKFPGQDPECDASGYPNVRMTSLGVNLTF